MTLYLLRHAQAGSRSDWNGDDRERPLTKHGRHQAGDLVDVLCEFNIKHIFSSPYIRCVETVAPLSGRISVPVDITEALAEGPATDALALARQSMHRDALFCSHGDIIPALLDVFWRKDRVDLGPNPRCQKGSVWILEADLVNSRFHAATYLAP